MIKRTYRWTALAALLAMTATLVPSSGAYAGSKGRRNTAYAVTALTGVLAYRYFRHPNTGRLVPLVAAGAGTYVAWHHYGKARKKERARERAALIEHGRRLGYRQGASYRVAGYRSAHPVHHRVRHHRVVHHRHHR